MNFLNRSYNTHGYLRYAQDELESPEQSDLCYGDSVEDYLPEGLSHDQKGELLKMFDKIRLMPNSEQIMERLTNLQFHLLQNSEGHRLLAIALMKLRQSYHNAQQPLDTTVESEPDESQTMDFNHPVKMEEVENDSENSDENGMEEAPEGGTQQLFQDNLANYVKMEPEDIEEFQQVPNDLVNYVKIENSSPHDQISDVNHLMKCAEMVNAIGTHDNLENNNRVQLLPTNSHENRVQIANNLGNSSGNYNEIQHYQNNVGTSFENNGRTHPFYNENIPVLDERVRWRSTEHQRYSIPVYHSNLGENCSVQSVEDIQPLQLHRISGRWVRRADNCPSLLVEDILQDDSTTPFMDLDKARNIVLQKANI